MCGRGRLEDPARSGTQRGSVILVVVRNIHIIDKADSDLLRCRVLLLAYAWCFLPLLGARNCYICVVARNCYICDLCEKTTHTLQQSFPKKFIRDSPEAKFLASLVPLAIRDQRLEMVSTISKVVLGPRLELQQALRDAIVAGQVRVVQAFLCRGPYEADFFNPSAPHANMSLRMATDPPRNTHFEEWPLIVIAARFAKHEIVKELLDAKADPSRTGQLSRGQVVTALYSAVKHGFPKTCRALLATVNSAALVSDAETNDARDKLRLDFYNNQDRATPLLMAARKGAVDLLRELVGAGASMSVQRLSCNEVVHSDDGQNPFLVKYDYSNRDLVGSRSLSLTPLGTCVYRRWPEDSIRALLDMKANPGWVTPMRWGWSAAEDAGLSPSSRRNRDQQQPVPLEGVPESIEDDEIPLALLAATALIPLTPHAPVVICGLESEAGQKLNGLRGHTTSYDGSKDRWGVANSDSDSSATVKSIKSENLRAVGDGTFYARLPGMPHNCFYDPLTAHESALARTELLLQRGARPFSAANSRYSFPEFFEELATNRAHRCHGTQYWAKLVELFLQYEANPERAGQSLLFALAAAVARERAAAADTMSSVSARAKLLLTDLSVDGAAVLRHAVTSGRADVIRELCAIAAEARDRTFAGVLNPDGILCFVPDEIMNHKFDPERQRTALHCAAEAGHEEVVQLLLEGFYASGEAVDGAQGVELVQSEDTDGHTALDLAAANGHAAVVAMLLRAGGQKWGRSLDGGKRLVSKPSVGSGGDTDSFLSGDASGSLRKAFEAAVSGQHVGVAWQLLLSAVGEAFEVGREVDDTEKILRMIHTFYFFEKFSPCPI